MGSCIPSPVSSLCTKVAKSVASMNLCFLIYKLGDSVATLQDCGEE